MSGDWKQNIVHRKCAAIRGKLDNFFAGNFFVWYFRHLSNLFHNKYSHICFANMFLVKHFPASNFLIVINLINQFTIIYNYFLILLDQTKTTLSIFFDNWVNRRKRNFFCQKGSALVYGAEYCIKYVLICAIYTANMTYCGISLWLNLGLWWQQLLGKVYGLRYLNEAMIIDSFVFTRAKSCRQYDLFVGSMTYWK